MGGNNEFFENFERNKYLKKLPSMQRVKLPNTCLYRKKMQIIARQPCITGTRNRCAIGTRLYVKGC